MPSGKVVRYELTVWRKSDIFGRNASKVGLEPAGLRVIADQFASLDDTIGKFCPVPAGNRAIPADWTWIQLNRLGGRLPEQPATLIKNP